MKHGEMTFWRRCNRRYLMPRHRFSKREPVPLTEAEDIDLRDRVYTIWEYRKDLRMRTYQFRRDAYNLYMKVYGAERWRAKPTSN